jgi:NitT/TauT family transport system substrate-binding protein
MSHREHVMRRRALLGAAGASLVVACAPTSGSTVETAAPSLGPLETTTVRIASPFACDPPLWLANDFLLEEGFTDIRYIDAAGRPRDWATKGTVDFGAVHPEEHVAAVDAGAPLLALAGLHSGCQEVWVGPGIASIRDLRGKRIAVFKKDTGDQFFNFFATALAYVGIDPLKDVTFFEVDRGYSVMLNAFVDGRSDAFLAAADGAALLRRNPRSLSTKILDQSADKPWSQYFCCLLVANRDWARQNPVAAKRFTRAVLRASDATVKDRPGAARKGVGHFTSILPLGSLSVEQILNETIAMPSYDWRELEPEETLRFFALRLNDVKLIKSTPTQIIAQGSDVGFMHQLRKELKA